MLSLPFLLFGVFGSARQLVGCARQPRSSKHVPPHPRCAGSSVPGGSKTTRRVLHQADAASSVQRCAKTPKGARQRAVQCSAVCADSLTPGVCLCVCLLCVAPPPGSFPSSCSDAFGGTFWGRRAETTAAAEKVAAQASVASTHAVQASVARRLFGDGHSHERDTAPTAAAAAARAITATAAAAARALTTTTPTAAAAAKGMMVAGRTALAAVLLGSASWISPCPAAAVGRVGRVPWCVGRTRVTCLTCPEDGSRRFWG